MGRSKQKNKGKGKAKSKPNVTNSSDTAASDRKRKVENNLSPPEARCLGSSVPVSYPLGDDVPQGQASNVVESLVCDTSSKEPKTDKCIGGDLTASNNAVASSISSSKSRPLTDMANTRICRSMENSGITAMGQSRTNNAKDLRGTYVEQKVGYNDTVKESNIATSEAGTEIKIRNSKKIKYLAEKTKEARPLDEKVNLIDMPKFPSDIGAGRKLNTLSHEGSSQEGNSWHEIDKAAPDTVQQQQNSTEIANTYSGSNQSEEDDSGMKTRMSSAQQQDHLQDFESETNMMSTKNSIQPSIPGQDLDSPAPDIPNQVTMSGHKVNLNESQGECCREKTVAFSSKLTNQEHEKGIQADHDKEANICSVPQVNQVQAAGKGPTVSVREEEKQIQNCNKKADALSAEAQNSEQYSEKGNTIPSLETQNYNSRQGAKSNEEKIMVGDLDLSEKTGTSNCVDGSIDAESEKAIPADLLSADVPSQEEDNDQKANICLVTKANQVPAPGKGPTTSVLEEDKQTQNYNNKADTLSAEAQNSEPDSGNGSSFLPLQTQDHNSSQEAKSNMEKTRVNNPDLFESTSTNIFGAGSMNAKNEKGILPSDPPSQEQDHDQEANTSSVAEVNQVQVPGKEPTVSVLEEKRQIQNCNKNSDTLFAEAPKSVQVSENESSFSSLEMQSHNSRQGSKSNVEKTMVNDPGLSENTSKATFVDGSSDAEPFARNLQTNVKGQVEIPDVMGHQHSISGPVAITKDTSNVFSPQKITSTIKDVAVERNDIVKGVVDDTTTFESEGEGSEIPADVTTSISNTSTWKDEAVERNDRVKCVVDDTTTSKSETEGTEIPADVTTSISNTSTWKDEAVERNDRVKCVVDDTTTSKSETEGTEIPADVTTSISNTSTWKDEAVERNDRVKCVVDDTTTSKSETEGTEIPADVTTSISNTSTWKDEAVERNDRVKCVVDDTTTSKSETEGTEIPADVTTSISNTSTWKDEAVERNDRVKFVVDDTATSKSETEGTEIPADVTTSISNTSTLKDVAVGSNNRVKCVVDDTTTSKSEREGTEIPADVTISVSNTSTDPLVRDVKEDTTQDSLDTLRDSVHELNDHPLNVEHEITYTSAEMVKLNAVVKETATNSSSTEGEVIGPHSQDFIVQEVNQRSESQSDKEVGLVSLPEKEANTKKTCKSMNILKTSTPDTEAFETENNELGFKSEEEDTDTKMKDAYVSTDEQTSALSKPSKSITEDDSEGEHSFTTANEEQDNEDINFDHKGTDTEMNDGYSAADEHSSAFSILTGLQTEDDNGNEDNYSTANEENDEDDIVLDHEDNSNEDAKLLIHGKDEPGKDDQADICDHTLPDELEGSVHEEQLGLTTPDQPQIPLQSKDVVTLQSHLNANNDLHRQTSVSSTITFDNNDQSIEPVNADVGNQVEGEGDVNRKLERLQKAEMEHKEEHECVSGSWGISSDNAVPMSDLRYDTLEEGPTTHYLQHETMSVHTHITDNNETGGITNESQDDVELSRVTDKGSNTTDKSVAVSCFVTNMEGNKNTNSVDKNVHRTDSAVDGKETTSLPDAMIEDTINTTSDSAVTTAVDLKDLADVEKAHDPILKGVCEDSIDIQTESVERDQALYGEKTSVSISVTSKNNDQSIWTINVDVCNEDDVNSKVPHLLKPAEKEHKVEHESFSTSRTSSDDTLCLSDQHYDTLEEGEIVSPTNQNLHNETLPIHTHTTYDEDTVVETSEGQGNIEFRQVTDKGPNRTNESAAISCSVANMEGNKNTNSDMEGTPAGPAFLCYGTSEDTIDISQDAADIDVEKSDNIMLKDVCKDFDNETESAEAGVVLCGEPSGESSNFPKGPRVVAEMRKEPRRIDKREFTPDDISPDIPQQDDQCGYTNRAHSVSTLSQKIDRKTLSLTGALPQTWHMGDSTETMNAKDNEISLKKEDHATRQMVDASSQVESQFLHEIQMNVTSDIEEAVEHDSGIFHPTFKGQISGKVQAAKSDENEILLHPVPKPADQKIIIDKIWEENKYKWPPGKYTYAVATTWYKQWETYAADNDSQTFKFEESPGAIIMDKNTSENNKYVVEAVWEALAAWYGVDDSHELDRQPIGQVTIKKRQLQICCLTPFSAQVNHKTKEFCPSETVGYIEHQLRWIFRVPQYKQSRLLLGKYDAAYIPIEDRKSNLCKYPANYDILALEIQTADGGWPTGRAHTEADEIDSMVPYIRRKNDFVATDWYVKMSADCDDISWKALTQLRETMSATMQSVKSMVNKKEQTFLLQEREIQSKLAGVREQKQQIAKREKRIHELEELWSVKMEKIDTREKQQQEREDQFQSEKAEMQRLNKISSEVVCLNVGGNLYTTSLETLRQVPNSKLALIFSGQYKLDLQSNGAYFIDRDGTHFKYILNYLRDGKLMTGSLPQDKITLTEILVEARYYGIVGLEKYMQSLLAKSSTFHLERPTALRLPNLNLPRDSMLLPEPPSTS